MERVQRVTSTTNNEYNVYGMSTTRIDEQKFCIHIKLIYKSFATWLVLYD